MIIRWIYSPPLFNTPVEQVRCDRVLHENRRNFDAAVGCKGFLPSSTPVYLELGKYSLDLQGFVGCVIRHPYPEQGVPIPLRSVDGGIDPIVE